MRCPNRAGTSSLQRQPQGRVVTVCHTPRFEQFRRRQARILNVLGGLTARVGQRCWKAPQKARQEKLSRQERRPCRVRSVHGRRGVAPVALHNALQLLHHRDERTLCSRLQHGSRCSHLRFIPAMSPELFTSSTTFLSCPLSIHRVVSLGLRRFAAPVRGGLCWGSIVPPMWGEIP